MQSMQQFPVLATIQWSNGFIIVLLHFLCFTSILNTSNKYYVAAFYFFSLLIVWSMLSNLCFVSVFPQQCISAEVYCRLWGRNDEKLKSLLCYIRRDKVSNKRNASSLTWLGINIGFSRDTNYNYNLEQRMSHKQDPVLNSTKLGWWTLDSVHWGYDEFLSKGEICSNRPSPLFFGDLLYLKFL